MSVTGEPGRGPMRVGTALADLSAGVFAAMGILVALHERERSGRGQWVQTSLLQAQIFMLDFQAARYLVSGEVAGQAGNNHPTGVPTGVFRTKDGYVNIAPTPVMWRRFCNAIEPRTIGSSTRTTPRLKIAGAIVKSSMNDWRNHEHHDDQRAGRAAQSGRVFRVGPSIQSIRPSPTLKSVISVSPKRCTRRRWVRSSLSANPSR